MTHPASTSTPSIAALAVAIGLTIGVGSPAARADEAASADSSLEATLSSLRQAGLDDEVAYDLVRSLTVEVGSRFAGSAGDRRAVAWATQKMEELGLENVRTEPVVVPRWIRGEAEAEILTPHPQKLILTALGGSIGTSEAGISAPILHVPSLDALEAIADEEVRGKIVFFDQSMSRQRDGSGYGQTVGIRSRGPSRAAAKGAIAVLIRSVGTGTHRFPHTGGTRYAEEVAKIPAAALAVPDADLLAAQFDYGKPVQVRLRLTSRDAGEAMSANVIGEVIGRERPDEIVLLAAHLDSWDLGTGAIDDGAGCATMMRVAQMLRELPQAPRRTVRVVLFANEEFGLSGARAYAEAHADDIEKHVIGIESDFGAGRIWRFRTAIDPSALSQTEVLRTALEPLDVEWGGNEARGGADLSPLRRASMPVADLSQDGTLYFDYHHTDDDTLDKIEPAALSQNVASYALFAYWAAETEADFGRVTPPAR